IETHGPVQYAGTPFAAALIVKFINLWLIKTPPGYSTLLVPAMNRFHIPFMMLSGLVDTDNYYREIHFPAICQLPRNAKYVMKQGARKSVAMGLARDQWHSAATEYEKETREKAQAAMKRNLHVYKHEHWRKKSYA